MRRQTHPRKPQPLYPRKDAARLIQQGTALVCPYREYRKGSWRYVEPTGECFVVYPDGRKEPYQAPQRRA